MGKAKPISAPVMGAYLSWEERLDIRKHALECASRVYSGKGDYLSNEYAILNLSKFFESYLKGEA